MDEFKFLVWTSGLALTEEKMNLVKNSMHKASSIIEQELNLYKGIYNKPVRVIYKHFPKGEKGVEEVASFLNTNKDIDIQIIFQSNLESKKITRTGNINSAVDKPNQLVLNAFPRDLVKYLEIVVVAVWDIIPCPENLIKNIAINKNEIDDILEKKNVENDNNKIT